MATQSPVLPSLYGDEAPYTITLDLRGVTPFLFNQMDLDAYEESGPGQKKRPRKKADYETMVWRVDGSLACPSDMLIASIIGAGKYFKTPIGSSGSASTTLRQALVIDPERPLASFGVSEWDCIDRRLARNSDIKRSPRPCYRPRLERGWLLRDVAISVVTPAIYGPARMLEIISRAGSVCGIGDGRMIGMGRYVLAGHEVEEGLLWE